MCSIWPSCPALWATRVSAWTGLKCAAGFLPACLRSLPPSTLLDIASFFALPRLAGFNTLLRYLDPLIISLACNMEPLIGSLLGWAAGVVTAPGAWTYAGGGLVMASTLMVSLASHRREQQAASRQKAAAQVHRILGGSNGGSLAGEEDRPLMQTGLAAEAANGFGGAQSSSRHDGAPEPPAGELAEDSGWGGAVAAAAR